MSLYSIGTRVDLVDFERQGTVVGHGTIHDGGDTRPVLLVRLDHGRYLQREEPPERQLFISIVVVSPNNATRIDDSSVCSDCFNECRCT